MSKNKQSPEPMVILQTSSTNTAQGIYVEHLKKMVTMSNNKQSSNHVPDVGKKVKLYTEEQLTRYLLDEGIMELSDLANNLIPSIELPSDSLCINCDESESTHNICMDCIIKIGKENIQLPSDEDIDNHIEDDFLNSTEVHKYSEEAQLLMKAMCKAGALWMRDKIQGGNNEQL